MWPKTLSMGMPFPLARETMTMWERTCMVATSSLPEAEMSATKSLAPKAARRVRVVASRTGPSSIAPDAVSTVG